MECSNHQQAVIYYNLIELTRCNTLNFLTSSQLFHNAKEERDVHNKSSKKNNKRRGNIGKIV